MGKHWIVARTKPFREMWAAENIVRQGYEFYYPKIMVERQRMAKALPLFASYIFVQTEGPWQFLLSTFGISGVVMLAGDVARVPGTEIDRLKAREIEGCVVLPVQENRERWRYSQPVRIKGGMFSGFYGLYAGMDAKKRERVLLDFLGRKTTVLLPPELLEAAE